MDRHHTRRRLLWRIYTPLFTLLFASLAMVAYETVGFEYPWRWDEVPWGERGFVFLFAAMCVFALAMGTPLIVGVIIVLSVAALFVPVAIAVFVLEASRKFSLAVLNKASSPRTSPFTYLAGLLSVLTAAIGLIRELLS